MIHIQSIQVGQIVTQGDPRSRAIHDREWTSAFDKRPIQNREIEITTEGLVGDQIADRRVHGGPDKAILCYAAEHYASWKAEHPDSGMGPGGFGENLTLQNINEQTACIGDVFGVGDGCLQISQPRQPCWKISRRWGIKTLTKEVARSGRTGWYVRVLKSGKLQIGDEWVLQERPHPNWSVSRANDVFFHRIVDESARLELSRIPELAQAWKDDLT